jgi:hypothetical protein
MFIRGGIVVSQFVIRLFRWLQTLGTVLSPNSCYDIADVYQRWDRSVPVSESGCFAGYSLSVHCPCEFLVMILQMFISGGIVVSQLVSPAISLVTDSRFSALTNYLL